VGNIYKTISQILAKRLQRVLYKIIYNKQSTLIEGRGTLDSIMVVNEVINEIRRKKKLYYFKGRF